MIILYNISSHDWTTPILYYYAPILFDSFRYVLRVCAHTHTHKQTKKQT